MPQLFLFIAANNSDLKQCRFNRFIILTISLDQRIRWLFYLVFHQDEIKVLLGKAAISSETWGALF